VDYGIVVNENMTLPILILSVGIIAALLGILYRNLSTRISTKVDKELYLKTVASIEKALESINGTAQTLKTVVESIASIHEKYLTIKEHDYLCALADAKRKDKNK